MAARIDIRIVVVVFIRTDLAIDLRADATEKFRRTL